MLSSTTRTFVTKCPSPPSSSSSFRNQTKMDLRTNFRGRPSRSSSSSSPSREDCIVDTKLDTTVSLQEWQGWGTTSQVPAMVIEIIDDLKALENDMNSQMNFGGIGGKLKGNFKIQEDKKHRATYQALNDSEKKLQFFSARQIACRLLGSKGYLCQKCWLALEDCMCSKIVPSSLWHGMRFWLYMHPKDFLRQNNTGKLLWQTFGVQAATLCIYGISEHEEIMWNAFERAGLANFNTQIWILTDLWSLLEG
ncbi:Dtw domain-containing protein [Thalictrum thalictroides]|uniref:tRNA-uridine aminocarboxypropyltransferase n=1 Tax=Thalictrum thalictroides TaxID=46969 RepID=A0A7J6WZQ5_THATH|nr:Dtw domain-containing protein [Thalictrum thalictroides]